MAVVLSLGFVLVVEQIKPPVGPQTYSSAAREVKIVEGVRRVWPNPKWISAKWDPKADEPFKSIQKEAQQAMLTPGFLPGDKWSLKFEKAYSEYYRDFQNPVKLFAAATYYGVALALEPEFGLRKGVAEKWMQVNAGFDYLKTVPNSYLFTRRAYMANAGDQDNHDYGNLGSRLLERVPRDRGVIIAMAYEYRHRFDRPFEEKVFRLLDAVRRTKEWRPWDDYHYAFALQFRAARYKDVTWLDKALELAKSAKAKSPTWANPTWIDKYIADIPGLKKYIKDNS